MYVVRLIIVIVRPPLQRTFQNFRYHLPMLFCYRKVDLYYTEHPSYSTGSEHSRQRSALCPALHSHWGRLAHPALRRGGDLHGSPLRLHLTSHSHLLSRTRQQHQVLGQVQSWERWHGEQGERERERKRERERERSCTHHSNCILASEILAEVSSGGSKE